MGDTTEDDSMGKALLAEWHRADEEFSKQSWRMVGWSFFLYAVMQLLHFLKQAFQGEGVAGAGYHRPECRAAERPMVWSVDAWQFHV